MHPLSAKLHPPRLSFSGASHRLNASLTPCSRCRAMSDSQATVPGAAVANRCASDSHIKQLRGCRPYTPGWGRAAPSPHPPAGWRLPSWRQREARLPGGGGAARGRRAGRPAAAIEGARCGGDVVRAPGPAREPWASSSSEVGPCTRAPGFAPLRPAPPLRTSGIAGTRLRQGCCNGHHFATSGLARATERLLNPRGCTSDASRCVRNAPRLQVIGV